jgi:hypothetical protein
VVYGALLLNHDQGIPERARDLVFGGERIDGMDIGTATLFLDDLRLDEREGPRGQGRHRHAGLSGGLPEVFEGGDLAG